MVLYSAESVKSTQKIDNQKLPLTNKIVQRMNPSAKMLHQMFKTGEQEKNYADIAINENEI